MIRFRFSNFEKHVKDRDVEIVDGELLSSAMSRVLDGIPLGEFEAHETFRVSVNGKEIDHGFWEFTKLSANDDIIISPILKSGEGGQIFKQALIVAISVVASYFLTPAGGATVYSALAVAGVTIGASLLLNALIPPPALDLGAGVGAGAELSASQMYAITGQSNQVKKLGNVPKLYGTHRVFPNVAANPYTELEIDTATGKLVQYLYCVYDLGLGPLTVDKIKIGDTPIQQFSDFDYALVDFKKPSVNEGAWDAVLHNNLQFYKGDHEAESISVALDKDVTSGIDPDHYEATRTCAINTDGVEQAIKLDFVNPSGLYGYEQSGNLGYGAITLDISFARVGTEDWHGFNDLNYVSGFDTRGGDQAVFSSALEAYPGDHTGAAPYSVISQSEVYNPPGISPLYRWPYYTRVVGIPAGQRYVVLRPYSGGFNPIGSAIAFKGRRIGVVSSMQTYAPGWVKYNLAGPIKTSIPVYQYTGHGGGYYSEGKLIGGTYGLFEPEKWTADDDITTGKFYINSTSAGKARIQRADNAPVYSSFMFVPRSPGNYKVRVRRESTTFEYAIDRSPNSKSQYQDKLTWITLSSRFDRTPINTNKRHVFLELKIRATNQLNGAIQNLSAVCTSVLDVYNGSSWVKQPTNNPAWVVADLLTGEVNKRAIAKSRLHTASLLEWAAFCDQTPTAPSGRIFNYKRFACNFVLDYPGTLQAVIAQVAGAAQASLNLIDGKYGVLIDKYRDTPIQIFTPRNSRDFTSTRAYLTRPHALRVKFIDPSKDWDLGEVMVYENGYTPLNATDIQDLPSFACTNEEQAWRFGRYMLGQNTLRQETMQITVDFEHLVCTRGDYVQICQDVMSVGGSPARVKSVSGNRIVIDDGLEIDGALSYAYVFRSSTGQIKTDTLTPVYSDTFDLNGEMPEVGDLIIIGEASTVVYDCLVKSITPNDDLSAQLVLIEKADGVYDYESTESYATYDPSISPTSSPDSKPPGAVNGLAISDNSYECNSLDYNYYIDIAWNPPVASIYETFQIFVNHGQGFAEITSTRKFTYRYIVDQDYLDVEHEFKVVAVSATGKKLELVAVTGVTATPATKTTPPSDVERLDIDITGEVLQLVWPRIDDCDCREYIIRYSPDLDATWQSSIPLLRADKSATLAATQARTGTYLIKAIDFNGNESANAAVAITTIPNLFNLNVIEEITDSPGWVGVIDRARIFDSTVIISEQVVDGVTLPEYYSEAYYYYDSLLDLGAIYSVRLQSLIRAEGYTAADLMENWVTLDSVLYMAYARYSDWDVETQYRSTETYNVIADWTTLDAVDAMITGVPENFTDWRKFIMGDATGRIFQFRIKLVSKKATVTPRVFSGLVRADMPDRVESYNNLVATIADGYTLEYDPHFAGPSPSPNVQITMDDGESGDYWSFDSKTTTGFQIRFYDKNGNPVGRQFDAAIKGYGRKSSSVI